MQKFTHGNLLIFLLIASVVALLAAYISQYFFNLQPCLLCLYQRKPFFAVIILTILALLFLRTKKSQKIIIYLSILLILINAFLALYHFGVEKKIFAGPSSCGTIANFPTNLEELKHSIENTKSIRCDQPAFIFLGLSMAGWNVIYCLFLATLSLFILRKIE